VEVMGKKITEVEGERVRWVKEEEEVEVGSEGWAVNVERREYKDIKEEVKEDRNVEEEQREVSNRYLKVMKLINISMDEEVEDEQQKVDDFKSMNELYTLISEEIHSLSP
jgi:hypothetical protein